ncbi:MAG: hypothetical protein LBC61_07185 [Candidatus Peribacteria bacterium]|nr:hypothetical protein [Candidatus Peribacteria bacterium]
MFALSMTSDKSFTQISGYFFKNFSKFFLASIFNKVLSSKATTFTSFGLLFDKEPSQNISHSHKIANFFDSLISF